MYLSPPIATLASLVALFFSQVTPLVRVRSRLIDPFFPSFLFSRLLCLYYRPLFRC